jgi:hypothetical protein
MRRELNRRLFIAEAVLLALPLTALLAFAITTSLFAGPSEFWPWGAINLITVLAAVATISGWWLLISAIRGGAEALRETHRAWWLAALLGCLLVLAAIVSWLLPRSPEYSPAAVFREWLETCIFGLPLVVVLAHLWAEARFRRNA